MNISKSIKTVAACAAALLLAATPARADLLLDENFDSYATGDLFTDGSNGWLRYGSNPNAPIQVTAGSLVYSGYSNTVTGNCVTLSKTSLAQDLFTGAGAGKEIKSGSVYAAFLLNLTEAPASKQGYFFNFVTQTKNGLKDKASPSEYGRIFATGIDDKTYKLGITRFSAISKVVNADKALNYGETYLVVVKYTFADGNTNDPVEIFINPATGATEPTADVKFENGTDGDASATYGIYGVELRQSQSGSYNAPVLTLDALRIATSWADLFAAQGGEDPEPRAAITVNPASVQLAGPDGFFLQGQTGTGTFTVKGSGLTSDITLTCANPAVSFEPASISADDANAAPVSVTVSYKATSADALSAQIVLASEGAADAAVSVNANVTPVTDQTNFAAMQLIPNESEGIYRYTGSMAKVTYVDEQNKHIYIQDPTAAIRINYADTYVDISAAPFKVGDKVKNLYLIRFDDVQGMAFMPMTAAIGDVTSSDNEITATEVTFSDLAASRDEYLNRLVVVSDVTLAPTDGQTWGNGSVAATDERGQANLSIFPASDLKGTPVLASANSITGISTSAKANAIRIRYASDIVLPDAEDRLIITPTLNYEATEWLEVGKSYADYGTLHVKASSLAAPVTVDLRGTDRALFALSMTEIPAGNGEYDITVAYNPTKVGKHSATIVFETTDNNTEINKTLSVSARAWDPANPPAISVDASSLETFSAKVGESVEQTVSYTVSNLLDYANVKVETPGTFIINSTTTPKYDGTYQLKVTFKPQSEGVFTNTIIFSGEKFEPVSVSVRGVTAGAEDPEQTQGDELVFEGDALPAYQTDFTSASAHNKPLSLEGWKNVASVGTRAWWSYEKDGNRMAKVTAYDSKATEETPAQMMLVSPCLDFKDAANRLLCFNIMGEFMTDNMSSDLGLYVVDAAGAKKNPAAAVYNPVDGLNFPCTKDENGTWARYVLDCEQWDLPDEFYVVFLYTSMRGREESCVYYIDDFSWGRTDMPFIRSSHPWLEIQSAPGLTATSESVTIEGHNLSQPIALSLSGSGAKQFTLSTTELPAEGGSFTVDYNSDETAQHTAVITLLSGSDARTDIPLIGDANPAGIADAVVSEWGDTVSVYDLQGRPVMTDTPAAEALRRMQSTRGTLYIVRTADATYKYIAK